MTDPNDPFADFERYEPPQKPERGKRPKAEKPPREKREKPVREPREPREKPVREPRERVPREPRPRAEARGNGGGDRRTVVILASIAGALVVAVVVVLGLYLQRSTPTADPQPAPTSATVAPPAPAPSTPAPTETAATPTAGIDVDATGFTIAGDDGETVFTHEWADDAAPAIDALTELFGAAPTEDFQNGDAETYAYSIYEWEGFRLYDVFLSEGNRPRSEVPAPTYVSFNTDIDVAVSTDLGIDLDMTPEQLDALGPDEVRADGGSALFVFGADRATFYQDGARTLGALVEADATRGSFTEVTYMFDPDVD